jgi:hypothetical protein
VRPKSHALPAHCPAVAAKRPIHTTGLEATTDVDAWAESPGSRVALETGASSAFAAAGWLTGSLSPPPPQPASRRKIKGGKYLDMGRKLREREQANALGSAK